MITAFTKVNKELQRWTVETDDHVVAIQTVNFELRQQNIKHGPVLVLIETALQAQRA